MKKLLVALSFMAGCSPAFATGPYIEAQAGLTQGSLSGESAGIRGGTIKNGWDLSLGYLRTTADLGTDKLISNGINLHTLSAEAYRVVPIGDLKVKLGGGLGYSIPDLSDGTSETADSGRSWVLGGGAEYQLSSGWAIAGMVKGLFFNTDTHRTVYSSHIETLNTGQDVEVLDVNHFDDAVNFNSVLISVGLRYSF